MGRSEEKHRAWGVEGVGARGRGQEGLEGLREGAG